MAAGLGGALQFVKAEEPVDPAQRVVRHHPDERGSDFEGDVPLLCLRANFPTDFQDRRMRSQVGRYPFQFLFGLGVVA
jgi:hypothetical protein